MDFLTKVAVKKGTIGELGNMLDDSREESQRLIYNFEGRIAGLKHAAKMTIQLHGNIDHDFDEGLIKEGLTPNEVRKLLKRYIEKAQGVVINLAEQAEAMRLQAHGKLAAYDNAIKFSKNMFDKEKVKEENFIKAQNGEVVEGRRGKTERPVGIHPGGGVKDRRTDLKVVEPEKVGPEDNLEKGQDALKEGEEKTKADTPTIDVPAEKLAEIAEKVKAKEDGANGKTV